MSPQRRQRLSEAQRSAIQARHNVSQTIGQIAFDMRLPKSTVYSVLKRIQTRFSLENLPHSGRPRTTSKQDDRILIRKALTNTRLPLKELRIEANSSLSHRTIQRRLRESWIQKHKAVVRARLTSKHVAARLKWAKEHLGWTLRDWSKVGFSDECSVEKGADPRMVYVFRRPGVQEKYKPPNVVPKEHE